MSDCPPERGSVAEDSAMCDPLTLTESEEEAITETDVKTDAGFDAETDATLTETRGLERVEGAVETVLGVLGMICLKT